MVRLALTVFEGSGGGAVDPTGAALALGTVFRFQSNTRAKSHEKPHELYRHKYDNDGWEKTGVFKPVLMIRRLQVCEGTKKTSQRTINQPIRFVPKPNQNMNTASSQESQLTCAKFQPISVFFCRNRWRQHLFWLTLMLIDVYWTYKYKAEMKCSQNIVTYSL